MPGVSSVKLSRRSTLYLAAFVIFIVAFAYLELTYTRRVDGTSMLPTLEEGDLVVIQTVPFSDLHVGDIIVYNPPCSLSGESVIHRVVEVTGNGVITQGDNNNYTDVEGHIAGGPVTPDCYVGKVVFVVPYIERIAALPDGANYVIAALLLAAVIYLWFGDSRPAQERHEAQATPTANATRDS